MVLGMLVLLIPLHLVLQGLGAKPGGPASGVLMGGFALMCLVGIVGMLVSPAPTLSPSATPPPEAPPKGA